MPPPETTDVAANCPRCHHHDVVCRHEPSPTDNLLVKLRFWLLGLDNPQPLFPGHDFEGE
jgi:hypothetical protein